MGVQKNQSGFSAVEVVLVIVLVAVLGFAVWYIKYTNSNKGPVSSSNTNIDQNSTATPNSKTLSVKEWGVKLTVPAGISNVTYTYNTASDSISFTSDTESKITICSKTINGQEGLKRQAVGTLKAADGTAYSDSQADTNSAFKHIGNYYYSRVYPGGTPCSTDSQASVNAMSLVDKNYQTAFATLIKL